MPSIQSGELPEAAEVLDVVVEVDEAVSTTWVTRCSMMRATETVPELVLASLGEGCNHVFED